MSAAGIQPVAIPRSAMKLVERYAGTGSVAGQGRAFPGVAYRIERFQAMSASGLPVPGLHRFEGRIDARVIPDARELVDLDITLELEDGRTLRLRLVSEDGEVVAEGHGPGRCQCC
ncbi:MAG TPA: hypothetical protein VFY39_17865 [Gammaproteobacteria bacterium]|nr:hypothetical protein [Gammaproteobacteria bacterium]